eukprot:TRINITY_DN4080_c0_g1_i1.p1 TRINITY_DN4080_c0_g1~~TRINITY_DN4080_c0_g1_i1.p1  ORF type:complete len:507 (+),score=147.64 TRINITY_DN4080_c0_g1_i1:53-1522(+)
MSRQPISKLDYLQKYLSKDSSSQEPALEVVKKTKKKKKKEKTCRVQKSGHSVKIIDTDVFLGGSLEEDPEDDDVDEATAIRLGRGEELPSVAGVVDSRPMEVIIQEKLSTGEWKPLEGWNEKNAPRGLLRVKEEPRSPSEAGAASSSIPRREEESFDGRSRRRRRHDSSSSEEGSINKQRSSSLRRKRRHDSSEEDEDLPRKAPVKVAESDDDPPSPPRRPRIKSEPRDSPSPPRRRSSQVKTEPRSRSPSSDASPPRMAQRTIKREKECSDSDASPPRNASSRLATKTLDGKKAGLQDGKTLKREMNELRVREKDNFSKLSNDVSGRGAETKIRGRLKEKEELKKQKQKEHEIPDEVKQKYTRWSKGLKQLEETQNRIKEDLHEMDKPLARSKDDKDLDEYLRNVEREEDPMLKFIKKKKVKSKEGSRGPKYPTYKGPQPFPNRFGIPPGYRWDGVDRSSGFEKQLVDVANKKKAVAEEALKWSQEDM